MTTPQQLHIPVLFDATLRLLSPKVGERYLDLTAGYGGHARGIIKRIGDAKLATLCDRDQFALSHLDDLKNQGAQLIHSDYLSAVKDLLGQGAGFDMVLLDIGVSSVQLDMASRGFSFNKPGELDMRMDRSADFSAKDLIREYSEKSLINLFINYGEMSPKISAKIARAIVIRRKQQAFLRTDDLAEVIRRTIGELDHGKYHKVHPATKAFQAIRIEVNDELNQLKEVLPLTVSILNSGGRLAVISFHSLEDRIVKTFMKDSSGGIDGSLNILTKKPIRGDIDDVYNPRARSAKLRVAIKK